IMVKNETHLDVETLAMLQNKAISITLPVVYTLVAMISIPGNLFSLWVLCWHIKPKTPSVIFMINLSITDLMLASCFPFQISYHIQSNHWSFGKTLCSLVTVMFYSNMYSSILTMTFSLVPSACKPVQATAICPWFSIIHGVFLIFLKELGIITCFDVLKWDMLPTFAAWVAFLLTLFVVLFLIPFVVTVGCYIGTIRKLIQTSNRYGNRQKTRSIYLAMIVLLVFITCFAPNNFILLAHMIIRLFYDRSLYPAYKLTLCLSCLNNCIDPFIYYFASKEFYQKFMQVFRPKVLLSDSLETRRESLFSGRTMSARSMSSGPMDGLDGVKVYLQRQESVF
ncbi:P2RY8 protein, partial [Balaeniceps rex]|nr:P2RY8 protein [Balaeniceps rex]